MLSLFGGNVLLIIGGYGFKIYLARSVGAEGLGLFALGESLISFVLVFVVWEMQQAAYRFIPEFVSHQQWGRLRRFVWASLWHVLILGGMGAAVLVLTRRFWAENVFHSEALSGLLLIFALMLPVRALDMVTRQIARGYKEVVHVVAIQTVLSFPVKVILSVALISMGWGVSGWVWGEVSASLLSAVLFGVLAFRLTPRPSRTPYRALLHETGVYTFVAAAGGLAFLNMVNGKLGTLLLGVFVPAHGVGIYSLAFTMVVMLTLIQSALNGVLAPHLAELNSMERRPRSAGCTIA